MTRLVAVNEPKNQAVLSQDGVFVFIDTQAVDVLKTETSTIELPDAEGWVSNPPIKIPDTWKELAQASTTSLTIEATETPDRKRIFRVPKQVQAESSLFSRGTATLGQIHEYSQLADLTAENPLNEWLAKILEKYPIHTEEAIIASAVDYSPDFTYFALASDVDSMSVNRLFKLEGENQWSEYKNGSWSKTEEPADPDLLIQLDEDSVNRVAEFIDDDDEVDEWFELSSIAPEEYGLWLAAESELDFEFLDRVFDVYDSTERSINATKQVRGQGGKFAPNPGGSEPTRDAPVARLPQSLPIVPDINALIDEYLRQVAEQRGEEPPPAPEPPDPDRKSFAVSAEAVGAETSDVKPMYIAIVDDIDPDAVLDVVALVPPAKGTQGDVSAWKRKAGQWIAANELVTALRGSTPPSVVKLDDEALLTNVLAQVDKATTEEAEAAPTPGETPTDATGAPVQETAPQTAPIPVKKSNFSEEDELAQKTSLKTDARKNAAKEGEALPDGSFPIKNKEDLRRAISAYGRAKNKAAAKRHIKKRARALDATDMLPDSWGIQEHLDMIARGYAFNDGSLVIRDADELREAIPQTKTYEQQMHVIKRARALNRMDLLPSEWDTKAFAYLDHVLFGPYGEVLTAAGGADRNRGNAERLRRYWTTGIGGAKIAWRSGGDWTRCVAHLSKYLGTRAKGYCALRHKEMNGYWPGDRRNR